MDKIIYIIIFSLLFSSNIIISNKKERDKINSHIEILENQSIPLKIKDSFLVSSTNCLLFILRFLDIIILVVVHPFCIFFLFYHLKCHGLH